MRIAGSLKRGTVQTSELIRGLLKSDRLSSLVQAIIETVSHTLSIPKELFLEFHNILREKRLDCQAFFRNTRDYYMRTKYEEHMKRLLEY